MCVILKVLFLAAFPGSYLFVFAKNISSRTREFHKEEVIVREQVGMTMNSQGMELHPSGSTPRRQNNRTRFTIRDMRYQDLVRYGTVRINPMSPVIVDDAH